MATPTGARHRDLEQRLRDIEAAVKSLVGAALRRQQLSVTSGDFVVSGGGHLVSLFPVSGAQAVSIGTQEDPLGLGTEARIEMRNESGEQIFNVLRREPNEFDADGFSEFFSLAQNIILEATNQAYIGTPSGSAAIRVDRDTGINLYSDAGDIVLQPEVGHTVTVFQGMTVNGTLTYLGVPTTAAAANLNYNTANGNIRVVTSSRRYKQDIEDAPDQATNLLSVQGRTWRDRGEVAEDPDTETRYVGYIAEELHDAGLTEYVEYDDQGQPHAIQYDRLTVPLVQLAQRQQAQLDTQAAQIADLVARVDALEPKPYPYA